MTFPGFPSDDSDPGTWSELVLLVATVLLEAEGEPDAGKLGVAFVIRNRMDHHGASIRTVVLGREGLAQGDDKPYEAFSCFNDDYVPMRKQRLAAPNQISMDRCWWAACAAYWKLLPDPTRGAKFYLNEELTILTRPDHKLPTWFKKENVRCRIGNHTFLL